VTVGGDPRVTRVGRFLRRYKIDELPQLANVFLGDMSLVGPRPEVRRYVDAFPEDYQRILKVRPGITDLAAIEYRDEESILAASSEPERTYLTLVMPSKIRLYDEYLRRRSFLFDLVIILRTIRTLFR
jgi:lipopolysaccharide/colanic/teichoic acid biosynthesis glycosyltransferase